MKTVVGFGGLGNRVNELINGALAFGNGADLRWHVNPHMPFEFEQIFIDDLGFNVRNIRKGDEHYQEDYEYWGCLREGDPYCSYWYPGHAVWERSIPKRELVHGYSRLMASLKAYPDARRFDMGAHYRGQGTASGTLEEFIVAVVTRWRKLNIKSGDGSIFLLADCSRGAITDALRGLGIPCVTCMAPEMSGDKDRDDLGKMRSFMSDFLTLNKCPVIVTSSSQSTMTDPARALGADITHVGPLRTDPACWFVVHEPETFKQQ